MSLLKESYPKARKMHKCQWCGKLIEPGDIYYRYTMKWDGEMQDTCMHLECAEASSKGMESWEEELPCEYMPQGGIDEAFDVSTPEDALKRHLERTEK